MCVCCVFKVAWGRIWLGFLVESVTHTHIPRARTNRGTSWCGTSRRRPTTTASSTTRCVCGSVFYFTLHCTLTFNHCSCAIKNDALLPCPWPTHKPTHHPPPSDHNKTKQTQVLEYRFPGHPAPPLGLMVKIALAVENWLQVSSFKCCLINVGLVSSCVVSSPRVHGQGPFTPPILDAQTHPPTHRPTRRTWPSSTASRARAAPPRCSPRWSAGSTSTPGRGMATAAAAGTGGRRRRCRWVGGWVRWLIACVSMSTPMHTPSSTRPSIHTHTPKPNRRCSS